MKFKRSTTSIMLMLIAISAISITSIQQDAFAEKVGMQIMVTAEEGSDTVSVTGQTMSQRDITFTVMSPSGNNVVDIAQVQPDVDGLFTTTFMVGDLWKENGFYAITAKQGESSLYTMTVFVNVTNMMTEATSDTRSNLESGMFAQSSENEEGGLTIEANAMIGSTNIEIIGMTDRTNSDVTLTVTAPNGNVVSVDQITPNSNGEFMTNITTGGPLWKANGDYTVQAQQGENGKYKHSVIVEIEDGVVVPEFGTIAVMILAVSIIAIIAVSARTKLGIIPRY